MKITDVETYPVMSLRSENLLQNYYLEAGLWSTYNRPEGIHWGWESPTCQVRGLDNLVNFMYNWQLETIPVLVDRSGSVVREYGVSQTPTTFLIAADGLIKQRWDGLALTRRLAFALQSLVGLPEFATSD